MPSVGHYLLNSILPEKYQIHGPITNKELQEKLVPLAKEDPNKYVDVVTKLKRLGDDIATYEGISVGLKDIKPDTEKVNAIISKLKDRLKTLTNQNERQKAVVDAQNELLAYTRTHPGSMTHMAVSGARGNLAQLMKIIGTPLAVNDEKKGVGSVIIEHAYSSGLTPAENWATMPEARANNVASVVSIAKPGEMNKVLIANMVSKIITQIDCGTHAGVHLSVNDANCLDRYIADDQGLFKRNTLITASFLQNAKLHNISNLLVRSPMTCAATKGVCQHCWGLDEKGRLPAIGTNVGVRSAQAMTEPLTQMSLSSKHSVLTIKEKKPELTGFKGVRQLLEVPQNFQHEAILAPVTGFITNVEKASQGGHYIDIADQRMYADPGLTVIVQTGTKVHAGDQLTNGIPHPAKVVEHKGLGEGRQYFVNALHRVYANEGVNLDKRHFELLAKTNMNFVRILEHDPDHPELLKGDTITYNTFRDTYAKEPVRKLIGEAVGHRLGEDIAHHTVGTPITETLAKSFQDQGIHSVSVIKKMPKIEFVMRNFSMNPLMDSDWIARLGHRQLKGSIQQAVQIGEESNIHGTHPIPAYVHGAELKTGPNGEY